MIYFYYFISILIFIICGQIKAQPHYETVFSLPKSQPLSNTKLPKEVIREGVLRLNHRHKSAKELPQYVSLQLFDDMNIKVALHNTKESHYKNMIVYRGRSNNNRYSHQDNYNDIIIIYNPNTAKYIFQLSVQSGTYEITPTEDSELYKVREFNTESLGCTPYYMKERHSKSMESACNEQDASGRYVADLFVGYSYDAAAVVNDIDAHALSLVEMVNNGLQNSLVDNIYIRLVGTGLNPENPGVVTSVLGDVYEWYEEEIELTGADYIASIQKPTGAQTEAGGWATVGGYSSVNGVNGAAAIFRHEIGHNVGSNHCSPGILPYAAGYDNGNSRTHMCGNNTNFYSTPLVNDDMGLPVGDAATADNARVWRERAPIVSARRAHTIVYDDQDMGCTQAIESGRYHIQNINSDLFLSTLDNGTNNGIVLTQRTDSLEANQWDLINMGSNKFRIRHVASGRLVDVPAGSRTAGTDLIIWDEHGNPNQTFTITESGSDTFLIQAFNSLCLQVQSASTQSGDPIEQNTCNDLPHTQWRLFKKDNGGPLQLEVSTTDLACYGDSSATARAVVSGGSGNYNYIWNTGSTESSIQGLAAGAYSITVIDNTSEEEVPYSFAIRQASPIQLTVSTSGATNTVGQASAEVNNGIAPLSYLWSSGATEAVANDLPPGLNWVRVTDANGCSIYKEVFISCLDLYKKCDDNNIATIGDHIDQNCNCIGYEVSCPTPLLASNLAINGSASQSSSAYSANAGRAIDGNTSGDYNNGSVTHTNNEEMPWWEVDLGSSIVIENILVWNRTDCCWGRLDNYYVFISDNPIASADPDILLQDGEVWDTLITSIPLPHVLLSTSGISGRYVRVQANRETSLHLAEIEVIGCGYSAAEIKTINPLSSNMYEVKSNIYPQGRNITQVEIEYGEGEYANSISLPTSSINEKDSSFIIQSLALQPGVEYVFRIKMISAGLIFYSDTYHFNTQSDHCLPISDNDFWYKRFNKVAFKDVMYQDSGNSNYEDVTSVHLGNLEMDSTYTMTLSTPIAGWTNLSYILYIDLNDDGDFTDYNEHIASSDPMGQYTSISFTIPHQDIRVDTDLHMRILGHEGGASGPCLTSVGNYKDFSVKIMTGACQGSGHIAPMYIDNDGDGYGQDVNLVYGNCNNPNLSSNNTDFNDDERFAFPGAPEFCDNIDNDGDLEIDEKTSLGNALLELDNEILQTSILTASDEIRTINNNVITNKGEVRFYSGNRIHINGEFEVPHGSIFIAKIKENCNQ